MPRRAAFPLVLFLVLAGACTSEDSPTVQGATTTVERTTATDDTTSSTVGSTTTNRGTATSTTTPSGPGIPLTGPVGSGSVHYSLAAERSEFCYRITVKDVGKASEAHLHRARPGQSGEVVLNLTPPIDNGTVNTCAAADSILIQELEASPADFYVDVHAGRGVVRGQLR